MTSRCLPGIALLIALAVPARAADVEGFDCWTFGMIRDQVKACATRGPYGDVRLTGGLETANGEFEGGRAHVSLLFQGERLAKIQVWLCDQTGSHAAVEAMTRAWRYMTREFGPIALADSSLAPGLAEEDFRARASTLVAGLSPDRPDQFQFSPVTQPDGAQVWTSVHRHPEYGYYVFLFFAKP